MSAKRTTNSYTKLRIDRQWGVIVRGREPHPGDSVVVTAKNGAAYTETVKQVVWAGTGEWLCRIVQDTQSPLIEMESVGTGCEYEVSASEKYPHLARARTP